MWGKKHVLRFLYWRMANRNKCITTTYCAGVWIRAGEKGPQDPSGVAENPRPPARNNELPFNSLAYNMTLI